MYYVIILLTMSRYLYTFTPIFTDRCGNTDAIDWETQGS